MLRCADLRPPSDVGIAPASSASLQAMQKLLLGRTAEWKELEYLPPVKPPLIEDEPEVLGKRRLFSGVLKRG